MDVLLSIRSAILYLLLGILISFKPSYTHACVCVCAHSLPYTSCLCVYVCVRVFVCGYIHICVWFCVGIFVFVCDFMCVSVYSVCVCVCTSWVPPAYSSAQSLSLPRTPLSLIFSSVLSTELCQTRVVWFSKQNIVHFLDRCFHTFQS